MALFEGKTPAERNKLIVALVFGAIALLLVGRMLFGSSSSSTTTNTNANRRSRARATTADPAVVPDASLVPPAPIRYERINVSAPEAGRNIFAFYVPPKPQPKPSGEIALPTPTPIPPPPLALNSLEPSNVFARTGDFSLKVSGDKFTPAARVYVDGQEVQTRFDGAMQLTATVSASFLSSAGARQIVVRTPDGLLYSNTASLNVMPPPTPNYTFVGIIGTKRAGVSDIAVIKDPKGELTSVQRGDLVGGRYRVTNISDRAVEFTDQELKIKHSVPFTDNKGGSAASTGNSPRYVPPQPPPKADDEEDEEP